ncbi:MAG TPA: site-specific DNA-methyltransferase [Anaerolineaceae bacterium]|nr:site-specific DNA-methyltransferase [Anaerolineaceae bacterium]
MDIERINKIVKTDIKEGLKVIYPEVFEDNKVNFEKLKALLSGEIIEKEDDRFYFNWAGKNNLYKLIQSPAYGTLKPDKERSIDFDNTENIVIVGENLETLKLMLKPYFGKVKMIYIDPPYNTGKDFIYRDNFKEPLKDYLEKTGQIDSEGKKLTTNTEASGRYHSDWLNFIYPRLFLARSLLRDDGVIFISIDDHEVHHLRMIMDEIFGEDQIDTIVWKKASEGRWGKMKNVKTFRKDHEYLLVGFKKELILNKMLEKPQFKYEYNNPDNDPRGPYKGGSISKREEASNPNHPYYYTVISPSGKEFTRQFELSKEEFEQLDKDGRIYWGKNLDSVPAIKIFINEEREVTPYSIFVEKGTTTEGKEEFLENFGGKYENLVNNLNPKPSKLIKTLAQLATGKQSITLDFFAGSGTTGHAVWDLNKEDGGNRKFILVQLDEEVQDEEVKKEFPTVADICIERLRRVSEKYKKENSERDFGFKVFKLDKSNFNLKDEFEFDPSENKEELKKKYLEWLGIFVDQPLVSGWKEIDVIYEVMLKEGLNLNSKIEKIKIKDDEFYYVKDEEQNLDFYISLKDKFSPETIEEIRTSKYKGKKFVFLDNALTDNDKINLSAFVRLKVI